MIEIITFAKKYIMKHINKILNYLIIVAVLFSLIKNNYENYIKKQELTHPKYEFSLSLDEAKNHFPTADSISRNSISSYHIYENGNMLGQAVNTSPYSDNIFGYNGTTPLTIFIDNNNRIIEVEACPNKESRGYMNKVLKSGFMESWNGLSTEEALNHQVDAVSGCTYTSMAIIQSFQVSMQQLTSQKAKLQTWDWDLFIKQICVIIVTILALVCFFNPKKTKKLRFITLTLSILILGFWTNSLLSLAMFYNWISNGISPAIQIAIIIIAILSIILPLITKKSFYCQYLCPFGAVQEFVGTIPVKKITVSARIYKLFSFIRKIILLTLVVLYASGIGLNLCEVEPFSVFSYQSIIFEVALLTAVIVVVSIFIKKPWCNYLCPTGTFLGIFKRN